MDLHEEAFETVRRWWRAWAERDLPTVREMLDPAYAERNATGHFHPMLPAVSSPEPEEVNITDWEVYDPVTKLFQSTIVCSYCFRISGTRGRRSFTLAGRATDVLSKRGESWTFISHQGTLAGEE